MTHDETDISLKMPTKLVEKLDTIAKQQYLNRDDVIIDACAYYCQFHDMNDERFPGTTRNILFNLARYDSEFRKKLWDVLHENPPIDTPEHK
jgi:metal-responsive CopG/Arc/MetJ family transcriptional regulator